MTKTISTLFMVVILLSMTIVSAVDMIHPVDALKSQGKNAPGRVGADSYGSANNRVVCGGSLCSEYPGGYEQYVKDTEKGKTSYKPISQENTTSPKVSSSVTEKKTHYTMHITSDTVTSITDPLIGHESHQLATILPFSDKIYTGTVTFAASEKVQLVVLHGPLGIDESRGQPTVTTPDGVKYALTFVDLDSSAGSAKFAGNMLALHTLTTEPFDVTYSVVAWSP